METRMPRKTLTRIRDRDAGLIDFLNMHLDESNWRQAVNAVVGCYTIHRKPTETPLAIAIDRDLTLREALRIQDALKALFQNERPRGMATLDLMQAVWVVGGALMQEHDGPRKCQAPGCYTYFIPKRGDRTCSAACSTKDYNARRLRQRRLTARKPGSCPHLRGNGQTCIFDINHAGPCQPAARPDGKAAPPGVLHP
jgi:hypothetical protein